MSSADKHAVRELARLRTLLQVAAHESVFDAVSALQATAQPHVGYADGKGESRLCALGSTCDLDLYLKAIARATKAEALVEQRWQELSVCATANAEVGMLNIDLRERAEKAEAERDAAIELSLRAQRLIAAGATEQAKSRQPDGFDRWLGHVDAEHGLSSWKSLPVVDPLHPNGRCTCAGEGTCSWCKGPGAEADRAITDDDGEPG